MKETDGGILLAYGSASTMTEVSLDEIVNFSGILTLDVTNAEFAGLEDFALDFSVHACGIAKSQCDGHVSAEDVYDAYEENGRE